MNYKISELPAAETILDDDLLPIVQNQITKKITVEDFFLAKTLRLKEAITVGFGDADFLCSMLLTDHNTVIDAAIAYAYNYNIKNVVIKDDGLYKIAAHINMKTGITLRGNSKGVILKLNNNVNDSIIRNEDETNGNPDVCVSSLTLDGNRTNQTAFTGGLIHFIKGATTAVYKVTDVNVVNSFFKGIYVQQALGAIISFCTVDNCGANGIDCFIVDDALILYNKVTNITEFVGIIVNRNGSYARIHGNTIDGISDDGIQIRGLAGGAELSEQCIITDNVVRNVGQVIGGQGIFINEAGNRRHVIANNQIYRSGVNGIEVTVTATEVTIVNNTIIESGYNAENGALDGDALLEGIGISCNTNGEGHILTGNRVINSWRHGISVGSNCNISNNFSYDNNRRTLTTASVNAGINFIDNCTVVGNHCYDTRAGASRTQSYGLQSTGTNNFINGNRTDNNVTSPYNMLGTNKWFYNDSTKIISNDLDARGFNVNGNKIQAVNSAGSIGGWFTRESGDVIAFYSNRTTTSANDTIRFYIPNDSGVATQTGSMTGGTASLFNYNEIKANTKFALGKTPIAAQTGGAFTFGATYTAAEQAKCQAMYDAMRAFGLLT